MEKVKILLLGWDAPAAPTGHSASWLAAAQALASHSTLHVLLPRHAGGHTLANVLVSDLSQSLLPGRTYQQVAPENLPYAPAPFPGMTLPLYGTPVYTGQAAARAEAWQPGEAVAAGHLSGTADLAVRPAIPAPASPDVQQQVIDYARRVCRLAHHLPFEEIHAFQWQTYLAALELKTITGRKLMIRVQGCSQDLSPHRSWMLELEKQVMEKADAVLVDHEGLAACLEKQYEPAAGKLHLLPARQKLAGVLPGRLTAAA